MKKRFVSIMLVLAMVVPWLPGTALAAEETPALFAALGNSAIVENGQVPEWAVLPDGMSFHYDEVRETYVLTLENVTLDKRLSLSSDENRPQPRVEIVLKGSNVIDLRDPDERWGGALDAYHVALDLRAGDDEAELKLYTTDVAGVSVNEGALTIDGIRLMAHCEAVQRVDEIIGLWGNSDVLVTGGAELDLWSEWIGFLVAGNVTFEDCVVNANRIHVHSRVNDEDPDNITSDQCTMTVAEGAQLNITSTWEDGADSALMLLDGSTLKLDGGEINCDFREGNGGRMEVGFNGDCAVNTLLLESGEMTITGDPDRGGRAIGAYTGRIVQNGGTLDIEGFDVALELSDQGSAQFNGGTTQIRDSATGILITGTSNGGGDKLTLSGGTVMGSTWENGLYVEEGRVSLADGSMSFDVSGSRWGNETGIFTQGQLVMSGGVLNVTSKACGMAVEVGGGEFLLQGGKASLKGTEQMALVSAGLTDLRGGELELASAQGAFIGILGDGDRFHLGSGMFLRTPGVSLKETRNEYTQIQLYCNDAGDTATHLSFGTTGGAFSGDMSVERTQLSVGVPFVVSADLALGAKSGTAVFTLPEGLSVKGQASVNGNAVASVYDSAANTMTVPVNVPGAAVRFYALAERTLEQAAITCQVTVEKNTHSLTCDPFQVEGLRLVLPETVSAPVLTLEGQAAPGGLIRVYDVTEEQNPVLLNREGFRVNVLGNFYGQLNLPQPPKGETTHTYQIRVELLTGEAGSEVLIDSGTWPVNYATHATKLNSLTIRNDYHGSTLDQILTNDIRVNYADGTVLINGSTANRAYNYFPEYPTFHFSAEFEDVSHIISAFLEATGKRGQTVSFPLLWNSETNCFEAEYAFPHWAPESFCVYWVEEGVVSRESVYRAAADQAQMSRDPMGPYLQVVDDTTQQVVPEMEDYFSQVTKRADGENRYRSYDRDGDELYTESWESIPYQPGMELTQGFEQIGQSGTLYGKVESDPETCSLILTLVGVREGRDPQVVRYTNTMSYVKGAGSPSAKARAADPGQRTTVFILKQVPKVGDVVLAVDSKLLLDSLRDFDSLFTDDLLELSRIITTTGTYRCPYTGQEISQKLTPQAAALLQELMDLQTQYNIDYQTNKDAILEDMEAALLGGVTLGVNKFGSKRVRDTWAAATELKDQYDGLVEDVEELKEFLNDPNGTMQQEMEKLMTPEGLVDAAGELDILDDETKELLDTLMDPDGTYQDAYEFMLEYQDKLTELRDRYTELLRQEIQGSSNNDDCAPPNDDTPPLPPRAGGEEIPIPAIKDPSGYVFEGTQSNRLSGVTTTLYYGGEGEEAPKKNADQLKLKPWDASGYRQSNPLTTDELGQYQWMVPDGWWQVKYEKAGYETVYSDWLPVPPPQTDVNVGMVSLAQPKLTVEEKEGEFILTFDKYLCVDTVAVELMAEGTPVYSRLTAQNTALAPDGETRLATRFTLTFRPWELERKCVGQLRVTNAETYAGVSLKDTLTRSVSLVPDIPISRRRTDTGWTLWVHQQLSKNVLVVAAGYQGERMVSYAELSADAVTLTGDTVKVFLLDRDTLVPLQENFSW